MATKGKITVSSVKALAKDQQINDSEIAGFSAWRRNDGKVSFYYRYRLPSGERPRLTLGRLGEITPDQARDLAKAHAGEVAKGNNPAGVRDAAREKAVIDKTKTVNAILDKFEKQYLDEKGLASAENQKSAFRRLVRPEIGDEIIYDLTRTDINEMMDEIVDTSGPTMADRTLAYLRVCFNWIDDDKFVSPIRKGMMRTNPKERARTRVLDNEEIKDLWTALTRLDNSDEVPTCFPGFVRALLLSAQRRSEVGQMHSDQFVEYGTIWEFEAGEYKGRHAHSLPITDSVRALFKRKTGFMFSSDDGETGFSGFSKAKRVLDRKLAELRKERGAPPIKHWTFHDLRRTARSIMSRYTTPDVAERVLGHAIGGVRGTYDRHDYLDEKRQALDLLAEHVQAVVQGKTPNIVPLRRSAAA